MGLAHVIDKLGGRRVKGSEKIQQTASQTRTLHRPRENKHTTPVHCRPRPDLNLFSLNIFPISTFFSQSGPTTKCIDLPTLIHQVSRIWRESPISLAPSPLSLTRSIIPLLPPPPPGEKLLTQPTQITSEAD